MDRNRGTGPPTSGLGFHLGFLSEESENSENYDQEVTPRSGTCAFKIGQERSNKASEGSGKDHSALQSHPAGIEPARSTWGMHSLPLSPYTGEVVSCARSQSDYIWRGLFDAILQRWLVVNAFPLEMLKKRKEKKGK